MTRELFQLDREVGDGENNVNPDGIYFEPGDAGGVGITTPQPTYDIRANPIPIERLGIRDDESDYSHTYTKEPEQKVGITPKWNIMFPINVPVQLRIKPDANYLFLLVMSVTERLGLRTPKPTILHTYAAKAAQKISILPDKTLTFFMGKSVKLNLKPEGDESRIIAKPIRQRVGIKPEPIHAVLRGVIGRVNVGARTDYAKTFFGEGVQKLRLKASAAGKKIDSRVRTERLRIKPDATHESFFDRVVTQPLNILPDPHIFRRITNIVKTSHRVFKYRDVKDTTQKVSKKVSRTFGSIGKTNLKRT